MSAGLVLYSSNLPVPLGNGLPVGSIIYTPPPPQQTIDQQLPPRQFIQNSSWLQRSEQRHSSRDIPAGNSFTRGNANSQASVAAQYSGGEHRGRTYSAGSTGYSHVSNNDHLHSTSSDDTSSLCVLNPNGGQSVPSVSSQRAKMSPQCCSESKIVYSVKHHRRNPANKNTSRGDGCLNEPKVQSLGRVLISRLQEWCCQLLWLTLVCVIGCCGEKVGEGSCAGAIRSIRRGVRLAQCGGGGDRMKILADIEMKLLRHLTFTTTLSSCPRIGGLSSTCGFASPRKRRGASRAPSPQLYAINEEELELELEHELLQDEQQQLAIVGRKFPNLRELSDSSRRFGNFRNYPAGSHYRTTANLVHETLPSC